MGQELLQASAETLARMHTKEAIGAAVEVLRDRSAFASDRLRAAQLILERGHGKPTSVTVSVPAKRAIAAALNNYSEAELMNIVKSRQRNAPTKDSPTAQTPNLPARLHGHEVVEGELVSEEELMAQRFKESGFEDPAA